jgi:hypothetical protein
MERLSNESIYKVFLLDGTGTISKIILFLGEDATESPDLNEYLDDKFKEFPHKIASSQRIHKDDSIRILKKKILRELASVPVSYDEIYLFGQQMRFLNTMQIYEDVTEHDAIPMTKDRVGQLLVNFDIPDLAQLIRVKWPVSESGGLYEKAGVSYRDLKKLDIFDKEIKVDIPIGFQFAKRQNHLFSVNPYNIMGGFHLVQPDDSENPLISFDNQLLLNSEVFKNTIFVCLAEQVFEYAIQNNLSQEYLARTYFPLLAGRNLIEKELLLNRRPELLRETEAIMTRGSFTIYKHVDMMYATFYKRLANSDIPYIKRGIHDFLFVLKKRVSHGFSLETLFKNIHASLNLPLIKYNPGPKQENLYRLYCDKVSKNGRKIPFLTESAVLKWSREMAKGRQISLFFLPEKDGVMKELFMDFDRLGNIRIYGECKEAVDEDALSEIVRSAVNPVIERVNILLRPSGVSLDSFVDFRQESVNVLSLSYLWKVNIDKKLDLGNYRGLLSGIFDIVEGVSDNLEKGGVAQFKRVENFKEMDAQHAFIREILQRGADKEEILNRLEENYGLSEDAAILVFSGFIRDMSEINGRIMENPGFPVMFQIPSGKTLFIRAKNILSLKYVDVLNIYIDSILRITQLPKTIPSDILKQVNEYKKSKIVVKDVAHVENVVAPVLLERPVSLAPLTFGFEAEEEDADEDFQAFLDFNAAEEEEEMEGGRRGKMVAGETPNGSPEAFEGVIDGMSLKKPNPFESRLKRLDPVLFTTKLTGKYVNYSQLCNSNINRQPVALTEEEKEEIDRLHPGSYEHAIKYGSDENHTNWFICPRYWCLKSNKSMTEEDIKQGKCAKRPDPATPGKYLPDEIIPEDADVVPKGKYVYQFKSQKEHVDKSGQYIPHYPGFGLKDSTHPKGLCLPCCFKKMPKFKETKTGQIVPLNEQAEKQLECIEKKAKKEKKPVAVKDIPVDYVKNAGAFPLEQGRFGYLPIPMQLFLQVDAGTFMDKHNPAMIADKKAALLRMGVEKSETQSFLAAMANLYSHLYGAETISIAEMREKIRNAVTLDHFVKYHNASLLSTFKPDLVEYAKYSVDDYEDTDFVRRMESKEEDYSDMILETIASYENFQEYLGDSEAEIDYTYLWDIVTDKNEALFKYGLNLVILEPANHDITDNVQLICPTNHYSQNVYDPKKPTVILIKQQSYYEPVYVYYHESEKDKVTKTLTGYFLKDNTPQKYDEKLHGPKTYIRELTMKINRVLDIIQKSTRQLCPPKAAMPRIYEFRRNIGAEDLYQILVAHHYTVDFQILNYQQNVIGFVVSKPELRVGVNRTPLQGHLLPCFPSAILRKSAAPFLTKEIESRIMDSDDIPWKDYSLTIAGLRAIQRDTDGKVLCAPHSKVIEDHLVVGILTETNQFLMIDPPSSENDAADELRTIRGSNYIVAEKELFYNRSETDDRMKKVKEIELESVFYSSFRALIRRFLQNDFVNLDTKEEITDLLQNARIGYKERLKKVVEILKKITGDSIAFCEIDAPVLDRLSNLADLYSDLHSEGENKTHTICLSSDDKSKIYFSKKNLIQGTDNEEVYYVRVADEIVRNRRIQPFLLESRQYLNTNYTEYVVNPDELILLQSLITHEYFEGLIPFKENRFIQRMNYATAEPLISQTYSNVVPLEEQYQMNRVDVSKEQEDFERACISNPDPTKQLVVGNLNKRDNIWNRSGFPSYAKELVMNSDVPSTFYPILYIVFKHTGQWHTVSQMRQKLEDAYVGYMELHQPKIMDLWKYQGKYRMVKAIENGTITWRNAIQSDEYGFSNLDLWVMCDFYRIPVVLFSSTKNRLVNLGLPVTTEWILLHVPKDVFSTNIFFVRGTGTQDPRALSNFHLIKPSFPIEEHRSLAMQIRGWIREPEGVEYARHFSSLEEHLSNHHVKEMVRIEL